MKIEESMTKNVITQPEHASVHEAVKLLNKKKIGCLIVINNDQITGIVTERDLLEKVIEKCRNPKETKISEIMTRHVIVGKLDMELHEAAELMFRNKVKKLPIIKENKLAGIITLTDIARAIYMDQKTMELIEKLANMHLIQAANK